MGAQEHEQGLVGEHRGGIALEWTELVGMTGEEAKEKIATESPIPLNIEIVPYRSFVTHDIRSGRVRIVVDAAGKVVYPPTIG